MQTNVVFYVFYSVKSFKTNFKNFENYSTKFKIIEYWIHDECEISVNILYQLTGVIYSGAICTTFCSWIVSYDCWFYLLNQPTRKGYFSG